MSGIMHDFLTEGYLCESSNKNTMPACVAEGGYHALHLELHHARAELFVLCCLLGLGKKC